MEKLCMLQNIAKNNKKVVPITMDGRKTSGVLTQTVHSIWLWFYANIYDNIWSAQQFVALKSCFTIFLSHHMPVKFVPSRKTI